MAFGSAIPEITVNAVATLQSITSGSDPKPAMGSRAWERILSLSQGLGAEKPSTVDLGCGAILGSGFIAFLVIPSVCSYCAPGARLELKRRPLLRDALTYFVALLVLIWCINTSVDGLRAGLFLAVYVGYVIIVMFSGKVREWHHRRSGRPLLRRESSIFRERYQQQNSGGSGVATPTSPSATTAATPETSSAGGEPLRKRELSIEDAEAALHELASQTESEPRTRCQRAGDCVLTVVSWPVVFPIDSTCIDCRIDEPREALYPATFLVSFVWICLWSFVVTVVTNRWVELLGKPSIMGYMGLCVVALGAEIPDAINAVTVASRGYGSMATSSCMGSQICNICLGLGLPWMLTVLAGSKVRLSANSPLLVAASATLAVVVVVFVATVAIVALVRRWPKALVTRGHRVGLSGAYVAVLVGLGVLTLGPWAN